MSNRSTSGDLTDVNLDLVAKIINNFENPAIPNQKSNENFRDGEVSQDTVAGDDVAVDAEALGGELVAPVGW